MYVSQSLRLDFGFESTAVEDFDMSVRERLVVSSRTDES